MPKIIVFLGPSLDLPSAKKILDAEYRPPAKRGDILDAIADKADIIGLIDGVFHQDCAVAHREILAAVKKGIKVIGASSMGALRAAEMDTLGMVGIGKIYRMYKEGTLVSDDEVALVFDPVFGVFTLRAAHQHPLHAQKSRGGRHHYPGGAGGSPRCRPRDFLSTTHLPEDCGRRR